MNSIHFRRWSEQLKDSDHEVYWFDILDQGYAPSMSWMTQITGWKKGFLQKRGRTALKKFVPSLFTILSKNFDTKVDSAFAKALEQIKPDVVHSFALQISCLPIYSTMCRNAHIKWMYSSWGSDIFMPSILNIEEKDLSKVLRRLDYLITDCKRDFHMAERLGFKNKYLGVFPGNGGVDFIRNLGKPKLANGILIKSYQDSIGRGDKIALAISKIKEELSSMKIFFVGASNHPIYDLLSTWSNVKIYDRLKPLDQHSLFKIYNQSIIYLSCSLSDGMPNMLIEAMGFGLLPIQSNPGGVMEEIIKDGVNGLLIESDISEDKIAEKLMFALRNLRDFDQHLKISKRIIKNRYNREYWKCQIMKLYGNLGESL